MITLLRFEKGPAGKKYSAIIDDGGIIKRIPFGAVGYEQYRDSTGLGLYSHLDHLDNTRRRNYNKRHDARLNSAGVPFSKDKRSAAYYSKKYLWS